MPCCQRLRAPYKRKVDDVYGEDGLDAGWSGARGGGPAASSVVVGAGAVMGEVGSAARSSASRPAASHLVQVSAEAHQTGLCRRQGPVSVPSRPHELGNTLAHSITSHPTPTHEWRSVRRAPLSLRQPLSAPPLPPLPPPHIATCLVHWMPVFVPARAGSHPPRQHRHSLHAAAAVVRAVAPVAPAQDQQVSD